MPIVKPTKPSVTIPSAFATDSLAVKTAYTAEEISSGYEDSIPQVLDGGNLNYFLDALFQYQTYCIKFADWLNSGTANTAPYINSSNQLDFATPVFGDGTNAFTGSNDFTSGSITAPTQATSDNSTNVATTEFVRNYMASVLGTIYPVGSIYIGTQNTCPMATLITGSTWGLVAQNKALWGGDGSNANTTINAGLPNITGTLKAGTIDDSTNAGTGAFSRGGTYSGRRPSGGTGGLECMYFNFKAASSNSIYGNSTTVQPPAYRVNVWRRTA